MNYHLILLVAIKLLTEILYVKPEEIEVLNCPLFKKLMS